MRRTTAAGACLVLLLVFVLSAYTFRAPILAAAGHLLVVADPVASADIIVIAIDAKEAGVLEAADLFHQGVAPRVGVFTDLPTDMDLELIRRGAPFFDEATQFIEQLGALGVTCIERLPPAVSGTKEEGDVLRGWLGQHRFRSIVVVTSSDHSRRVSRVLRRALQGQSFILIVKPSSYSAFDPEHWWQSRENLRTGIIELQKLLLDVVLHPM